MAETQKVGLWAINSPNEAAKILAASAGLKVTTALTITKSRRYEVLPIQYRAIEELPTAKAPGWVIPEPLKSRWELILGRSQGKLPALLE